MTESIYLPNAYLSYQACRNQICLFMASYIEMKQKGPLSPFFGLAKAQ